MRSRRQMCVLSCDPSQEAAMKFYNLYLLLIFSVAMIAALFVSLATLGTRNLTIKHYDRFSRLFGPMTVIALILGVIGIWHIPQTPYLGYDTTPDYRIIHLDSSGPAAAAGIHTGDA